jgi:molecular chaperone Hsp33
MIKKKIEGKELTEHLASLPEDGREVFLLHDGQIRVTALQATKLLCQMKANHGLGPLETYILGQAYLAAGLLSATVKGNDRIQLNIECGGPIGGISIEAWACGAIRGYLKHVPIPVSQSAGSLDLNQLYGPGFLSVTKLLEGNKAPFTGQVMMQYGDLAKDLALYYRQSEQTPSLFYLSMQFDRNGSVTGGGGLFLQAMPGCDETLLDRLQERSATLPGIGTHLSEGGNIREYVESQFADISVRHLAHQGIGFSCPCTRENFASYLKGMGAEDKQEILEKGPFPLELVCFNCNTTYSFEKDELEHLFANAGEEKR